MNASALARYQFEVYAGYHQFYLQDQHPAGSSGAADFWTQEAHERQLAINPGIIGIGTASYGTVPVTIELYASAPANQLEDWDQVTEASLELKHDQLIIMGCPDEPAGSIAIAPGVYRVRIGAGGFETVAHEEGDDFYHIALWPADDAPIQVIKQWTVSPAP